MRLNVQGMTCGHCERSIKQAISSLGGTARVDVAAGTVDVDGVEDANAIRRAIEDEGYTVVDGAPEGTGKTSGCCSSR